jgi:hypothetical protein
LQEDAERIGVVTESRNRRPLRGEEGLIPEMEDREVEEARGVLVRRGGNVGVVMQMAASEGRAEGGESG